MKRYSAMADFDESAARANEMGILATRMESLHEDVTEMKVVLRDLGTAITKLTLIEERQEQSSKLLAAVVARVEALEKKAPAHDNAARWVERGLIALLTGLAMYVGDKLGIKGN